VGPNPREDRQRGFFLSFLQSASLGDIESVKLIPTWRTYRMGNAEVARRLDRFLVSKSFLEKGFKFKTRVEDGGSSDHCPISLCWKSSFDSPPAPLKINQVWLEDEDFWKIVVSSWERLSPVKPEPLMFQIEANLKRTKLAIKKWILVWKARKHREVLEIESNLSRLLPNEEGAPSIQLNWRR
jgi:hypothetical protein